MLEKWIEGLAGILDWIAQRPEGQLINTDQIADPLAVLKNIDTNLDE